MQIKQLINITARIDNINHRTSRGNFLTTITKAINNERPLDIVSAFKRRAKRALESDRQNDIYQLLLSFSGDSDYRKVIDELYDRALISTFSEESKMKFGSIVFAKFVDEHFFAKPMIRVIVSQLKQTCAVKIKLIEGSLTAMKAIRSSAILIVRHEGTETDNHLLDALHQHGSQIIEGLDQQIEQHFVEKLIHLHANRARRYGGPDNVEENIRKIIDNPPVVDIGKYFKWAHEDVCWGS